MSYAFMCIAFVVQIVSMVFALRSLETETVFMGIPLASLSFYYFLFIVFLYLAHEDTKNVFELLFSVEKNAYFCIFNFTSSIFVLVALIMLN